MLHIERFECNPFQENCYVMNDETHQAVIIDCGAFYAEERSSIVEYMRKNSLTPVHLISTHAHIDHNFGNDTIYKEFGLLPEVSASDERLMAKLSEQAMLFANICLDYEMPPVGKYLSESDVVDFGTHHLTVIPTPGHTPGSVFFYCKEEGVAFSGDTLFNMSIGRTDFEFGSYRDIMASLQKIISLLPDDTAILPGHGPKTTIGKEKQVNLYLKQA